MAILNSEQGSIVIQIVYAGMPLSGKTTTLKTLADLLFTQKNSANQFYSPDNPQGPTDYFDWLSYTGGYFRGNKIHCQIVSVPGQKAHHNRRRIMLERADVVVFVWDSQSAQINPSLEYFQEMLPWLEREDGSPVGIIVQANKRDSEDAVAFSTIQELFADRPNVLILESIATQQTGVRETFVSAVRIALERASWLLDNDMMRYGAPDLTDGPELLQLIQTLESQQAEADKKESAKSSQTNTDKPTRPKRVAKPKPVSTKVVSVPKLPDKEVITGNIYPSVSGRIILHKVDGLPITQQTVTATGEWRVTLDENWILLSQAQDSFVDQDQAKAAFIEKIAAYAGLQNLYSAHRCLALVESGNDHTWRIWQVVRKESDFNDLFKEALSSTTPKQIAKKTCALAEKYLLLIDLIAQQGIANKVLALDGLTLNQNKPVLTGFMWTTGKAKKNPDKPIIANLLQSSFEVPFKNARQECPALGANITHVLHQLEIMYKEAKDTETKAIIDSFRTLFTTQG